MLVDYQKDNYIYINLKPTNYIGLFGSNHIHRLQYFMNIFAETPLLLFNDDSHSLEQSFLQDNSDINDIAWHVVDLEEPKLLDCDHFRERKSTGLEIQDIWEEQFCPTPELSKETTPSLQSSKSSNKNQTKNIPKNYGKAIILYIKNNKSRVRKLLNKLNLCEYQFNEFIKDSRCRINTIQEIRNFWTDQVFGKAVRILSFQFMRRHSFKYIFNSRIKNHITHVKYRNKLIQGLQNPSMFIIIKDF